MKNYQNYQIVEFHHFLPVQNPSQSGLKSISKGALQHDAMRSRGTQLFETILALLGGSWVRFWGLGGLLNG